MNARESRRENCADNCALPGRGRFGPEKTEITVRFLRASMRFSRSLKVQQNKELKREERDFCHNCAYPRTRVYTTPARVRVGVVGFLRSFLLAIQSPPGLICTRLRFTSSEPSHEPPALPGLSLLRPQRRAVPEPGGGSTQRMWPRHLSSPCAGSAAARRRRPRRQLRLLAGRPLRRFLRRISRISDEVISPAAMRRVNRYLPAADRRRGQREQQPLETEFVSPCPVVRFGSGFAHGPRRSPVSRPGEPPGHAYHRAAPSPHRANVSNSARDSAINRTDMRISRVSTQMQGGPP